MEYSTNLSLPYLMPAQAQKHLTHNEALHRLDQIAQLSVLDHALSTPPSNPNEGDQYIVSTTAIGEWAGMEGQIATFENGVWHSLTPKSGWRAWSAASQSVFIFDGVEWKDLGSFINLQNQDYIGIHATADINNRLSINANASLFNHDGNGHQLKINKNASNDTASLLFQSGFSGHAEMGLSGDLDFRLKVSDGSGWFDALRIDHTSGHASVPMLNSGSVSIANDFAHSIPTPSTGGIVLITVKGDQNGASTNAAIFSYQTGANAALTTLLVASNANNQGTPPLGGTTGPDGSTNIAMNTNQINIENRTGQPVVYSYLYLG